MSVSDDVRLATMLKDVQVELTKKCGLNSIVCIKAGMVHLRVEDVVHLCYRSAEILPVVDKYGVPSLYVSVLEDLAGGIKVYKPLLEKIVKGE